MPGRLVMCATPIGNLGDVSPRLSEALETADLIFAEDTRRASKLLAALGVSGAVRSYFVGNEEQRRRELSQRLAAGATVAVITDAGTPAVSDPGLSAVQAAQLAGAEVTVVPGPSAVTAALAVAGLPADRFVFEGFLPRAGRARRRRLAELAVESRTMVVFSPPHRLVDDLSALADDLSPDRRCCVCRELTKLHEEVWWGSLGGAVAEWTTRPPKGEFTLVIQGAPSGPADPGAAIDAARALVGEGLTPSEAARTAAREHGVDRRTVYEGLVEP